MTAAHWIFLILSGLVIIIAGVLAVIQELRREGFLWQTWVLRAFFLLVTAGVGFSIPKFAPELTKPPLNLDPWLSMVGALILFLLVFSAEVFAGAVNISAIVFGATIGIIIAHLAYFLLLLVIEPMMATAEDQQILPHYALAIKTLLSVVFAYLFVLLIHKNRNRFNFVIPYVEFRRERRSESGLLVDTSAIIDGRLAGLYESNVLEGPLVVPRFVLRELKTLADSRDKLKRTRGRRGLDTLNYLRNSPTASVQIDEGRVPGAQGVDAKLIKLAETLGARIITTDLNLNKVANLHGVRAININNLAAAMKPTVLPGEELTVELIHPGEEHDQAVGYMDDGTMVVAENARHRVGSQADVVVTRLLQTSTGRIIFAKLKADEHQAARQDTQENR